MGELLFMTSPAEQLPPLPLWKEMLNVIDDKTVKYLYSVALEAMVKDPKWRPHFDRIESARRLRNIRL